MSKAQVFEFVILGDPTEKEAREGKGSEVISGPTPVLARDEQQAAMLAGRAIPETWLPRIDRVRVAVRPF
jgi:hypothetical protein